MCEPTTIALASLAIGAAQAGTQYQAQKNQAEFAEKAATVERNQNLAMVGYEQSQQQQVQADAVEGARREAQARQATARLAGGEAGVQGISVDAVLNELSGRAGENLQNIETNYARTGMAAANERTNINQRFASTLANNPRPSGLALGLNLAGQAVGSYSDFKKSQS